MLVDKFSLLILFEDDGQTYDFKSSGMLVENILCWYSLRMMDKVTNEVVHFRNLEPTPPHQHLVSERKSECIVVHPNNPINPPSHCTITMNYKPEMTDEDLMLIISALPLRENMSTFIRCPCTTICSKDIKYCLLVAIYLLFIVKYVPHRQNNT